MNLTVTIMAAGEGKRMNSPLPKILHLFHNTPMLIRIINQVMKINPSKIIIITGKYNELIQTTVNKYIVSDKIIFIQQVTPSGTGDAIKSTLNEYSDDENILILNGDMPLIQSDLLKKFIDGLSNYETKLLVSQLNNPHGYGRILYDNQNKFIGIIEEKDCNISEKKINIVNVGIYFFKSTILKKYIPLITNNNSQKEYYLTDIVKLIIENSDIEIKTYLIEDEFKYQIHGVNTQQELFDLENTFF